MTVAIVGGGPRAVFALDALVATGAPLPHVTVFEPARRLGAGWIYDPDQPEWLRLNVAADAVLVGSDVMPSFDRWRRACPTPVASSDRFPARATAGRYLVAWAERLVTRFPSVEHVRSEVVDIDRAADGRWAVVDATGQARTVDDVLVVVGHARHDTGALRGACAPYPVAPLRDSDARSVAIRGAALTAIDATLACTEGRDGRFVPSPRRPGAVEYVPGARTPDRVTWVSRTAELLSTKTEPGSAATIQDLAAIVARHAEALRSTPTDRVVAAAAADIATAVGARSDDRPTDPAAWLERDVRIARGLATPDLLWARGQAWRALYPALVARHRRWARSGGAPIEGWSAFGALARTLERLAFGPPAVNAEKMLALLRAGVLEVRAGTLPAADTVVDAVLPGPGITSTTDPLWTALLGHGLVRVADGRRGVAIDGDGTAVVDGARIEGLAVLGRATEDVVLGNDSLAHRVHPHLARWARGVVDRAGRHRRPGRHQR